MENFQLKYFKRFGKNPQIVVIFTSSINDEDLVRSHNLIANSYVRKPLDFEQLKQIGLYSQTIRTPIMIFTAMAGQHDKEEALMAGANEVLIKPDDLDKLVQTVQQLLNLNSQKRLNFN